MVHTDGNDATDTVARRLFFALWPESAVRDAIAHAASQLVAMQAPDGRPQAAERYHLTLQFLGDVRTSPVDMHQAALAAGGDVRARAFDLSLDRAGSFAGSRVWWLGPQDPPAGLSVLREQLGQALSARGVPIEAGDFTAHVTVHRNVRRLLPSTPIPPIAWPVRGYTLVESFPGRPDAYRSVANWALAD